MNAALPPRLESLLRDAQDRQASDLHLLPNEPPAIRVGGSITRMECEPLSAAEIREIAEAVVGKEALARIGREVGEVRRSIDIPGELAGLLCAARSQGDYTIAVRLFCNQIPTVEQARIPEAILAAVSSRNGLVIISGLTGSGKTTAAYTLTEHINATSNCHICAVEDPVAYRLTPKRAMVQQRGIALDVPDALSGIHASVEQDADVLLVSEIRGLEELQACISAAETGHLVIVVMHAAAPEDAVRRIIDVFPEDVREASRRALASVLRAVSTQKLLPRADQPGRVPAYGVIVPDAEMRAAIAEGRDFLARRAPLPEGCRTMAEDVEILLREGLISQDTARRALGEG